MTPSETDVRLQTRGPRSIATASRLSTQCTNEIGLASQSACDEVEMLF